MKPRKALLNSIEAYYRTLKEFEHQRAFHEGAVSVAFQTLLSDAARPHGWTLIPQLSGKQAGRGIRPDGTFKDQMNLVRGHWTDIVSPAEASKVGLEAEVLAAKLMLEESVKPFGHYLLVANLALPQNQHAPTRAT